MSKKGKTVSARAPDVSEQELQRKHERFLAVVVLLTQLGASFFRWGGVLAALYVSIALPIKYSSGQTTVITYVVQWVTDLQAHIVLPWIAGASGLAYGWQQRRRRVSERAERDARIEKLELGYDPNRTSSELSPDGESRRKRADDRE